MSEAPPLRVLYLHGSRAEERDALEYLQQRQRLIFTALRVDPPRRSRAVFAIWLRGFRLLRGFRPTLILSERIGVHFFIGVVLSTVSGTTLAVRVKGDPRREYDISKRPGSRAADRLKGVANYVAARSALRRCAIALPISDSLGEKLRQQRGDRLRQYRVFLSYREPQNGVPGAPPPRPRRPYLLTVSNFRFREKIEPLCEAVAAVAALLQRLDLFWVVAGDGVHLSRMRELAAQTGCAERIIFTGRVDPSELYRNGLLLLYLSRMDTLSNVVLEAFSERLPVVINADFPVPELLADGAHAAVVGSAGELSAAIERLAADARYRGRISDAAYSFLQRHFHPSAVGEQLLLGLRRAGTDDPV